MTNLQETKENEARDSRTINIEIPANCFEKMSNMMAKKGSFGNPGSSCCEVSQDLCCPEPVNEEEREIRIVIKRKKQ